MSSLPPQSTTASLANLLVLAPIQQHVGVESLLLRDGRYTIGTAADCEVVLAVQSVSPQHCVIEVQGGKVVLVQWDAKTWLNQRTILGKTELKPDDRLAVGPVEFLFRAARRDELNLAETRRHADQEETVLQGLAQLQSLLQSPATDAEPTPELTPPAATTQHTSPEMPGIPNLDSTNGTMDPTLINGILSELQTRWHDWQSQRQIEERQIKRERDELLRWRNQLVIERASLRHSEAVNASSTKPSPTEKTSSDEPTVCPNALRDQQRDLFLLRGELQRKQAELEHREQAVCRREHTLQNRPKDDDKSADNAVTELARQRQLRETVIAQRRELEQRRQAIDERERQLTSYEQRLNAQVGIIRKKRRELSEAEQRLRERLATTEDQIDPTETTSTPETVPQQASNDQLPQHFETVEPPADVDVDPPQLDPVDAGAPGADSEASPVDVPVDRKRPAFARRWIHAAVKVARSPLQRRLALLIAAAVVLTAVAIGLAWNGYWRTDPYSEIWWGVIAVDVLAMLGIIETVDAIRRQV